MEQVSYLGRTLTRWRVGSSTFLAMPELGARLMNWNVTLGDGSVRDILYWPELTELGDIAKVRGGNPILFPFSARTFDQGAVGWWRAPSGERLPMPNHGFARQGKFDVTRVDERGFAATFQPDDEARKGYPFDYEFSVVYRFSSASLTCEFILRNHDRTPIPWSPGHHFYFTVPWAEGLTRADYQIKVPAGKTQRQDAAGKLVDAPALKSVESLANPALIDAYHAQLKGNTAIVSPAGDDRDALLVRNGLDDVPAEGAVFVTWTTDDQAPFYCIEPWMGPANAPEHGVGLQWVQPGKTGTFVVEVALNRDE